MTAPTPDQMNAAIAKALGWECPRCHGDWKHERTPQTPTPLLGLTLPCGCFGEPPNYHGDSYESDRAVDLMVARGWEVCITFETGVVIARVYLPDGSKRVFADPAETRSAAVTEAIYNALGLGE